MIDMLELAKKLIPDIEDNMPAAVREAFDAGKVKAIFRTGTQDIDPETGMRFNSRGTMQRPSSTYFLLDDGRAARHGFDDTNAAYKGKGRGWMGARASVPKVIPTQDDPFVFDRILFGDGDEALKLGSDVEEVLKSGSGITSDPVVGKNIYETFSEDGKITKFHGGNAVKDIYKRDGTATFFEDAADPIYNKKMSPITTAIDDLDFVEKQAKNSKVKIPKLKSAGPAEAAPAPTTARIDSTPPPSGSTMKPVGASSDVSTKAKMNTTTASSNSTTPTKTTATVSSNAGPRTTSGVVKDAIEKSKSSSTTRKVTESLDAAKNVVKGKANARNLLIAGAASIIGVGMYQRNRQTRIEPDEQYY